MGELEHEPNISKHLALAFKCDNEYEESSTNPNTINLNQEKNNQFTCNFFKVCHQNIRGLFGKTEQLLNSIL
jgi:hypothetical protein